MSHEATLIYSETLLRQAVFAFWRRSVGVGFLVALLVASLGLGLLVTQGVASWLAGALAAVLVLGIGFAAAVYVVHYRKSLRKFRQIDRLFVDREQTQERRRALHMGDTVAPDLLRDRVIIATGLDQLRRAQAA